MRRVFGPRTVIEALFLIAVPIVALAAGLGWVGILIASAAAYLVVLVVEAAVARGYEPSIHVGKQASPPQVSPPQATSPAAETVVQDHVRVIAPEPVAAAPVATAAPVVEQAPPPPPPVAEPQPEPVAVAAPPPPAPEPVVVEQAPPPPAPQPEPAPSLVAVPDLPPEPAPAPVAAEPALPPAAEVVQISAYGPPRQWNVWDLERLARERAGANPEKDEERTYLLMYLREFADANGMLPVDFDGLVRDSFGDLVFA